MYMDALNGTGQEEKRADIEKIRIDSSLPLEQRMKQYLERIKDPYCFLCGKTPVRICFSPEGEDLDTKLKHYIQRRGAAAYGRIYGEEQKER